MGLIIHGSSPPCPNNTDNEWTTDGGHLFQDATHTSRGIFDASGFNAVEICTYCGLYSAAVFPDDDSDHVVSYFGADNDSKEFALVRGLQLGTLMEASQRGGLADGALVLKTKDFSLGELEDIVTEAKDYGWKAEELGRDETGSFHRVRVWVP